jgi:hypothetical protein
MVHWWVLLGHWSQSNLWNQNSSGNNHKSQEQVVVSFWHPFHVASSSDDRRHMAESRANLVVSQESEFMHLVCSASSSNNIMIIITRIENWAQQWNEKSTWLQWFFQNLSSWVIMKWNSTTWLVVTNSRYNNKFSAWKKVNKSWNGINLTHWLPTSVVWFFWFVGLAYQGQDIECLDSL